MSTATSTWRLILDKPAPGAWNMAVDEAILEAASDDTTSPTLRLYAWEPACLSLGYAQPATDADASALEQHGWDLVRRPTGGRAILHTDELTYAVIGPARTPSLTGSVLESYHKLSQALLLALQTIGLQPEADPDPPAAPGSNPQGAVCFEVPSRYEITVRGKKLIGSAQRRSQNGVLQHGSLPLCGDLTRITQALYFADATVRERAAARLLERAATLEQVAGRVISWELAAQAMMDSFQAALGVRLAHGELTEAERTRAQTLVQEKYAHPAWTGRI